MAYPTPSAPGSGAPFTGTAAAASAMGASASSTSASANCSGTGFPQPRGSAGEHLLEKLEFALAVAITRGDTSRIQALREQITALGGNSEEPGT